MLEFELLLQQEIPRLGGKFKPREYGEIICYASQVDDVMGEDTVDESKTRTEESMRGTDALSKLLGILGHGLSLHQYWVANDIVPLFKRVGRCGQFSFDYVVYPMEEDTGQTFSEQRVNELLRKKRWGFEELCILNPKFEETEGLATYWTEFYQGSAQRTDCNLGNARDMVKLFGSTEATRRKLFFKKMGKMSYNPSNLLRGVTEFMKS